MQYFLNRGQVQGPYTREQIVQYVQQNQLNTQDLIANQAEGPYFALGSVWQLILSGSPFSSGMTPTSAPNMPPPEPMTPMVQPGLGDPQGQLHSQQSSVPAQPDALHQTKTGGMQTGQTNRTKTVVIASVIGVAVIGVITIICMALFGGGRGPRSGATALEGRWQYEFVSGGMREPTGEIYFQLNDDKTVRLIEITGKDKLGRPIVLSSDYDIAQNVSFINTKEARGLFPEGSLDELGNQLSYAKLTSENEFGYDQTVHLVFNGMGNEAKARIDVKFGKKGNTSTIYAKFRYLDDKKYDEDLQRDFPDYQEVKGRVTVNGKPLNGNYQISFVPMMRNRTPIASGKLNDDGSYELFSGPLGINGIKPGKYRVSIAMLETDEQSFRISDKDSKEQSSDGGSVEIPAPKLPFQSEFGDAHKSPLVVEIVAGKTDYDIELESP